MTQDEQNDADIRRVTGKRINALAVLEAYKEWHWDTTRPDGQLIYISLAKDILKATETELDTMVEKMTEHNMRALQKKMAAS